MADVLPSQLANSVMAKLYNVLANGDETVPSLRTTSSHGARPVSRLRRRNSTSSRRA